VRVNLYQTVEWSDADRVKLAGLLDGDGSKPRQATRDEIKAFMWEYGRHWPAALAGGVANVPVPDGLANTGEDLLGRANTEPDLDDLL
jgi:hypothetical protein